MKSLIKNKPTELEVKVIECILGGITTTKDLASALDISPKEIENIHGSIFINSPPNREASFDPERPEFIGIIPGNKEWSLSETGRTYTKIEGIKPTKIKVKFRGHLQDFTNYLELARGFVDKQPIYYDINKIWWIWDFDKNCYVMTDETDVLNATEDMLERTQTNLTTRSAIKNEILESLRRVGRRNRPKKFPKTWVQFSNKIVDMETGEEHLPTSEYFCTNPIPWKLGKGSETPIIDKILTEWVGKDWVVTLKQIIAYAMLPDYPVHRMFALVGAGSNGKGCFLNLLKLVVGKDNTVSTSLERLVAGRFETAKLFKKTVCLIGETNVKMLEKTDILKRASGGDLIPGEIKNKNPFDFNNYAKIIVATNSLPITTDRTDGFYRRWLSIDFPNRFTEEKDILATIPEKEYENLGRQCVELLKEFLKTRVFYNEGTIEERKKRYEERSDPVQMIVRNECVQDVNGSIVYTDFMNCLEEHISRKGLRTMFPHEVTKILKNSMGLDTKNKNITKNGKKTTQKHIIGIKWKSEASKEGNTDNIDNTVTLTNFPYKEINRDNDTIDTIDIPSTQDSDFKTKSDKKDKPKKNDNLEIPEYIITTIGKDEHNYDALYTLIQSSYTGLDKIHFDKIIERLKSQGIVFEPSPGMLKVV